MPSKTSAGLLMYRERNGQLEVLLVHPGGPFARRQDEGHWSIPKGEIEPGENLLATAIREFKEEVGIEAGAAHFQPLGTIRQKSGKWVHAWAVRGEMEPPNPPHGMTFSIEWPPYSGKQQAFPEVDRVEFMPLFQARIKLKKAQWPFLERLEAWLAKNSGPDTTEK